MPFDAQVFRILIASPGDVGEERQAIPEVIARWNDANAELSKIVLLPVKWETHSAPLLGDRPQSVINKQIVTSCDMAIGVFGTRLGSPTGVSVSGTAEEIEWFIENGRPVMVYFSSRSIDPTTLDIDQYKAVKEFEKRMKKLGLTGAYTSITDFKEQLLSQITVNIRALVSGKPVGTTSPSQARAKVESLKQIAKAGTIYMEDYEKDGRVKSFLVKGDTLPLKKQFKEIGGRWNPTLGGWIFPKTREVEIAEFIKKNA